MLRNRIPDSRSMYSDPVFGVNLSAAKEDVQDGESPKMQNAIYRGGTRTRNGSQRITATQVQASLRVRGGIKYYYSTNSSVRLVAYGTKVSTCSDAGSITELTTALTSDQDVFFTVWPITDIVYVTNNTDDIYQYDGTTFQKVRYSVDFDFTDGTNWTWVKSNAGTSEYALMDKTQDVNIRSSSYQWTLSGSGTSEYYCEASGGGDPGLTLNKATSENGDALGIATLGSMTAGSWNWGDNDTLGFSTVYVRLSDSSDPDGKADGYVKQHYTHATLTEPTSLLENGTALTTGTVSSLASGRWDWGDGDGLGVSTVYVRLTDDADPDSKASEFVIGKNSSGIPGTEGAPAAKMVIPILDRLIGITTNGIERTDARTSTVWSQDSSWATLRPSQVGQFTALHPFSTRNTSGSFLQGAIAFQPNAHYLISGTDFGDDVTAASASASEDVALDLMDPNVGTSSPYSITSVPGIGLFWFTTDRNVFWLPFGGQIPGRMVGDRIRSEGDVDGIESTTLGSLNQVWMVTFDRFLVLGVPVGGNTYATTQWWMDLKEFIKNPDLPVWYGPMTGQTVGRAWVENQTGDNKVVGGEGNTSTGVFVYQLMVPNVFKDAVGTDDNNIAYEFQTYYKSFGSPGREKYVRSVEIDSNIYTGTVTVDVEDIEGGSATALTVESVT